MNQSSVSFAFDTSVPLAEVEATLRLALLAVESLHGVDRMQLELHLCVERAERRFIVDTSTDVGRTLAVIFSGYARREFGDDAVRVTTGALAGVGGGA